jgi:periplasmic protein TonB
MAHSAPHSLAASAGFVSPALSQRAAVLGIIVAFHIVLVYLLASGLGSTALHLVVDPAQVEFIDERPDETAVPPPPPPPELYQAQVDPGPISELVIATDATDGGTALTLAPTDTQPVTQPVQPRIEPIHLIGKHQLPNTEEYYPASRKRLGIEGAADVNVCVDERGKRSGEPSVTKSSGDALLDKGALDVVRAGRYARAVRGETAVPNCYGFRVIFKMQ